MRRGGAVYAEDGSRAKADAAWFTRRGRNAMALISSAKKYEISQPAVERVARLRGCAETFRNVRATAVNRPRRDRIRLASFRFLPMNMHAPSRRETQRRIAMI